MKENVYKSIIFGMAALLVLVGTEAPLQAAQTPLPGILIPQFVDPLPVLDLTASGLGIDTLVAGQQDRSGPASGHNTSRTSLSRSWRQF
jgi:hypothetical protein